MKPWERLAAAVAPDGARLELRRRGEEHVITVAGRDLMSSEDAVSARALAELGCAHLAGRPAPRVLIGGLGMGFTLRAALDATPPDAVVEVAELVPAVVDWNRDALGALAGRPLADHRVKVILGDVREVIGAARGDCDAILLDVDNGPGALAHAANDSLYSKRGLHEARGALREGGALGVWSYADDRAFTARLEKQRFRVTVHRVSASRRGRGRYHYVWIALRP